MKKYILCLANSHKYNERCIAGVELIKKDKDKFYPTKIGDNFKWMRPISVHEHGELSSESVCQIKLLDIIEIEVIKECPTGYQSENVLIDETSIKLIRSTSPDVKKLDRIIDDRIDYIFLNQDKAIGREEIIQLNKSLIFIKPIDFKFIKVSNRWVKNQLRVEFWFNNVQYNLPITDVNFLEVYRKNLNITQEIENVYFTISLGLEFNGLHYKLIAGVIHL